MDLRMLGKRGYVVQCTNASSCTYWEVVTVFLPLSGTAADFSLSACLWWLTPTKLKIEMPYYVHQKAWTKVSIVDFGVFVYSTWADPKLISFILKCEKNQCWSCVMLSWLKILSCWPFSKSLIIIFFRFYIQDIFTCSCVLEYVL